MDLPLAPEAHSPQGWRRALWLAPLAAACLVWSSAGPAPAAPVALWATPGVPVSSAVRPLTGPPPPVWRPQPTKRSTPGTRAAPPARAGQARGPRYAANADLPAADGATPSASSVLWDRRGMLSAAGLVGLLAASGEKQPGVFGRLFGSKRKQQPRVPEEVPEPEPAKPAEPAEPVRFQLSAIKVGLPGEARAVSVQAEGHGSNTDPARRQRTFDAESGILSLADGRQLYREPVGPDGLGVKMCRVALEGEGDNTDPDRRTWRFDEETGYFWLAALNERLYTDWVGDVRTARLPWSDETGSSWEGDDNKKARRTWVGPDAEGIIQTRSDPDIDDWDDDWD